MKCPYCDSEELKVTDSRNVVETNAVRRRRECHQCHRRFTTFEIIEVAFQVQKRDGKFETFQQQKLVNGLEAACRHTKISRESVVQLAHEITQEMLDRAGRIITTTELGAFVMERLRVLDTVAYIRFACVYRRFQDLEEVIEAIKSVDVCAEATPV